MSFFWERKFCQREIFLSRHPRREPALTGKFLSGFLCLSPKKAKKMWAGPGCCASSLFSALPPLPSWSVPGSFLVVFRSATVSETVPKRVRKRVRAVIPFLTSFPVRPPALSWLVFPALPRSRFQAVICLLKPRFCRLFPLLSCQLPVSFLLVFWWLSLMIFYSLIRGGSCKPWRDMPDRAHERASGRFHDNRA